MKKQISLLIFILLISFSSAHNPRITFGKSSSIEDPFVIKNPEVSQAFYGDLKGKPDYYKVNSNTNFQLYVSLLTADLSDAREDFVLEILSNNQTITLNGSDFSWTKFYEEFAGDNYLQGSEFDNNVSSGDYIIKISNKDNLGKYSLAVGKKESFTLKEMINTYLILPKIKSYFFEKPAYYAFLNIIGIFLLLTILIILLLVLFLYFILKRIFKKHK